VVIHLLRYDDFSACSSAGVEESLIDILLNHRAPCTFAVIPWVCDPETLLSAAEVKLKPVQEVKAEMLKPLLRAGLAEVALHGYSHLMLAPVRGYEEFSQRMPLEIQRQLIRRGRDYLEDLFGIKIRLYVPPWNRLASSTAIVLHEEGFLLSAGALGAPDSETPELTKMPCPNAIGETSRALETAQLFGSGNEWVGTAFHDYDFHESNLGAAEFSLPQFESLLYEWKNAGNVRHQLISDTIASGDGTGKARELANCDLNNIASRGRIRRRLGARLRQVHWKAETARRLADVLRWIP